MQDFRTISDDDLMWRTQEINMTICQPLFAQMNECQQGQNPRLSSQQCKDISVLYNACLLSAMDRPTKDCIDEAQNNTKITSQRDLISHVRKCLTNDHIKQRNEQLSVRLNDMMNQNPMRNVLHKYRVLNQEVLSSVNQTQYSVKDSKNNVEKRVTSALGNRCKQQRDALAQCVENLQKSGRDELAPMCFKEMVHKNFCLSSVVCGDQISRCAKYVNREKKIHQVCY